MCRNLVILFLSLLIFPALYAQEKADKERIRLVHANSLEFDRSMGKDARRLIGNVRFQHGKATMDCDSAYLYSGRERLKAYGNVHIIHQDSIHLYGDSLRYSGAERKAHLKSNVRVEDPEMTLRTDTLLYDISRSTARYRGGGRLKVHESQQRLKSRRGIYYADAQRMHFQDDVVLTHPDYRIYSDTLEYETAVRIAHFRGPTVMRTDGEVTYCERGWYDLANDSSLLTGEPYIARDASLIEADTLRYRREKGIGKAKGKVYLRDTLRDMRAFSGKGSFDRQAGWVRLTEHPVVMREFEQDTLFLRADTIRAERDTMSGDRKVIAQPEVRFFRRDLQGRCDSMSYEGRDSTIRLFQDPVLWSGSDRISGDTIRMRMDSSGIRQVEIPAHPFMSSQKNPPYFDQMKGRRMKALFDENDRIRRIEIRGKGRTLHFPEEDGKKKEGTGLIGMNRTASADINIRFREGEMHSVHFIDEPTGTLYPMDRLDKGMIRLAGFEWNEKGRATGIGDITRGSWIHGRERLKR